MQENDANDRPKTLVIRGRWGSELRYLTGPAHITSSWVGLPDSLAWELEEAEEARRYCDEVIASTRGMMGFSITDIRVVFWPDAENPACAPSPPPEAREASGASALSPSPHSEATPSARSVALESPRSPPEPPGAAGGGEEGEEGEEGDLARSEAAGTLTVGEGEAKHKAPAPVKINPASQAPAPWNIRGWQAHAPPVTLGPWGGRK